MADDALYAGDTAWKPMPQERRESIQRRMLETMRRVGGAWPPAKKDIGKLRKPKILWRTFIVPSPDESAQGTDPDLQERCTMLRNSEQSLSIDCKLSIKSVVASSNYSSRKVKPPPIRLVNQLRNGRRG